MFNATCLVCNLPTSCDPSFHVDFDRKMCSVLLIDVFLQYYLNGVLKNVFL